MSLNIGNHMSPAGLPARSVTPISSPFRKALPSQPPLHRSFVLAALALTSLWTAACGDGATAPPPAPPNQAPVRVGAIPAQTVGVGETTMVNVAGYFTDPDGDALTYTATSSNAATATVAVSGSSVTVTATAQGVVTVTVTATDSGGLSAQQSFEVTVPNQTPVAMGTVTAQTVYVGETAQVDMATYFTDPDGDALTYTATSSNAATATVAVSGSSVTVTATAQGVVTVTVTATDSGGLSAQQSFEVTVPNQTPVAMGTVTAQTVYVGETAQVDMATYFTDPDGDALIYTATSSNAATATVAVSGSLVTVTATAQGVVTVTVTATDPGGLSAQQSFEVTVPNQTPVAMGTVTAQTVYVGETAQVDMAGYFTDPDGDALIYTATSSNAATATVAVSGSLVTVTATAQGVVTATVTATDPGGLSAQQSFEVTVPNRAPVPVGSLPAQTLAVGQTVAVDASPYFEDPDGDALTYAAASTNADVASATVSGNVVTVTALARGPVSVTVTANDPGGLSGQQSFEVAVSNQAPVVRDSIQSRTLGVDETLFWSGPDLFRDPDGDSLIYAAASSNLQVVRPWVTGADLLIQALSPGTSTVTFSANDPEGLSARIVFDVTVLGPVAISGTDPAVLLEGATATVFGSGFSATAAQNQVSVGGLAARVTAATETALSIEVPRADCLPPRRAELRVTVGEQSDARTVGVTPRSQEDLELPQGWYRYTYAGDGCVHLPGNALGDQYLIGVVSVSEDPASLTGVTLTGMPGDATVVGAEGARIVVAAELGTEEHTRAVAAFSGEPFRQVSAVQSANGFEELLLADDTLRMRRARAHNESMARNEALLRRLGRARPPALADARRELQVGDTLTLFADYHGTCTNSGQVSAVVRLVGNSSIWLDDRDNPAETFTDSELADLDAFYSNNVDGVHDEYFGGLSDVDGNGRFLVLMTKEVNRTEDVAGWVWPADLYATQQCATSNQAEVFYGQVPDPNGSVGDAVTKQAALDYYPSVLTHEVTHLVQANAWVFGNAGYTSWRSEGGATLAEQLVAYRLFGHGSSQELGWSAYGASDDSRYWYWNAWVADMAAFWGRDWRGTGNGRIAGAPEQCSWVGREEEGNSGPCLGSPVYGVPSMVLRYAMDRWGADYPGGERAMMRRLTQSPARGFAPLVDVSPDRAWRMEHILSDFYIALWLDLQGAQAYGMTTWNLQDIFGKLPSNARLQPHTSSSTRPRLTGRRVRAGSALYFHWTPTGALSPTSIKVTSPGGRPIPDHISVWALRVR